MTTTDDTSTDTTRLTRAQQKAATSQARLDRMTTLIDAVTDRTDIQQTIIDGLRVQVEARTAELDQARADLDRLRAARAYTTTFHIDRLSWTLVAVRTEAGEVTHRRTLALPFEPTADSVAATVAGVLEALGDAR